MRRIAIGVAILAWSGASLAQDRAAPSSPGSSKGRPVVTPAPPPEPTPAARASKLRDDANAAMLSMRYADALDAYVGALALTPEDAGLYYSIARAQQFLGNYPEALVALEKFEAQALPATKAKVGKLDDLFAEIRPRVATLELKCSEVGARVLVRDKVVGVTPLSPTRLPSGASTVQVELDGFFTETRDVALPGGGALSLEIQLHRKSTSGLLGITSNPIGALVSIDGRDLGTTSPHLEATLPAGPHEVRARHEGYNEAKLSLVVAPGVTRELSIPLEVSRSVATRWWFWTTVGVAVAGGVALTYALTSERAAGHGTLTPGQVGGP